MILPYLPHVRSILPHFNSLEHVSAGFALDLMDFMVENRGKMHFFEN
jgi:hypothetical protein